MHVIEAVCNASESNNRSADIAEALRISAGTLTTTVSLLVKKGCLTRRQDEHDRRIVRLYATDKGSRANALHQQFHQNMVADVTRQLHGDELDGLIKGLERLQAFFENNK
jgi:DNA-binding MarR family transcriptional regulator